jgi:hypothetical protein
MFQILKMTVDIYECKDNMEISLMTEKSSKSWNIHLECDWLRHGLGDVYYLHLCYILLDQKIILHYFVKKLLNLHTKRASTLNILVEFRTERLQRGTASVV